MNIIKKFSYFTIELIDKLIHRKKISNNLSKLLKKPKFILDIGAHKGIYTDMFLNLFSNQKIILFEPNIYLYKKLILKYKKKKNVKIFNYGIGEKNSYKNFSINKNSDYVSSFSKINKKSKYLLIRNLVFGSFKNQIKNKKILVKKLDSFSFLKEKNIDLIKIDVEGFEEKVLEGGLLVLKKTKVVLIEFHKDDMYVNYNYKSIHQKLLNLNFKLYKIIKFPLMSWEDRIYCKKVHEN